MNDIVTELLEKAREVHGLTRHVNLYDQAADEITRLRQLLSEAEKREREARAGWGKLDAAYSNFVNGYGDPYEPKDAHDAETARNLKDLADAVEVYRALQSEER